MLPVGLITEVLLAKKSLSLFTLQPALLINHHELLPLRVHGKFCSCASRRWPALPGPIISPLGYTNMLIIRVWEKSDGRACKAMRAKKRVWEPQFGYFGARSLLRTENASERS